MTPLIGREYALCLMRVAAEIEAHHRAAKTARAARTEKAMREYRRLAGGPEVEPRP